MVPIILKHPHAIATFIFSIVEIYQWFSGDLGDEANIIFSMIAGQRFGGMRKGRTERVIRH